MKSVVLDFETASPCDLRKCGAWRYAEDPLTEIICLGYGITGAGVICMWGRSLFFNQLNVVDQRAGSLEVLVTDPAVLFVAHNAGFEKAIWRRIMVPVYGWPDIPNSRWHDSQAICAMKAIPLKLEKAALVLHLHQQKDTTGHRAVMSLSKMNRKGYYERSEATLATVYEYNCQDVRAETELSDRIGGFQAGERDVWLLDQRINERGARVDLKFVSACQRIVEEASRPLGEEFRSITGIQKIGSPTLKGWCAARGVDLPNLQKATIDAALGFEPEEDDDDPETMDADDASGTLLLHMPKEVRRVLEIRRVLGGAAVKKLAAFQSATGYDNRVRGLLQYHAAGPGRWAGRLVQPQNFPRGSLKVGGEPPPAGEVANALLTGDWQYVESLYGPAIEVVASGLRHAIVASPGRVLNVGDFAKIECVIVLALAGAAKTAADVIEKGSAVYTDMATKVFQRPIKKTDVAEYTIGKNIVLGSGFQMGWKKFKARYASDRTDEFCKLAIDEYRKVFAPEVPKVWEGLEEAAVRAVWDHTTREAYGVTYQHEDLWLTARLPSGRKLYYFNPRPVRKAMPWDETDIRPAWTCQAQKAGRWITRDMYGGLETENVVQALARDLMCHAMFRCERENLPIVLTVHDEIVAEPLTEHSNPGLLGQIMADRPRWAIEMQIPVAAECWAGERYAKK